MAELIIAFLFKKLYKMKLYGATFKKVLFSVLRLCGAESNT